MEGHLLTTKQEIRYFGVQVDNRRRFGAYLEKVWSKADTLMGALRSLLPNVNGLTDSARKLYGVWESRWCSVVLCASKTIYSLPA